MSSLENVIPAQILTNRRGCFEKKSNIPSIISDCSRIKLYQVNTYVLPSTFSILGPKINNDICYFMQFFMQTVPQNNTSCPTDLVNNIEK